MDKKVNIVTNTPGPAVTVPAPPGMIWMQRPVAIPGVPPGLEYLTQVDSLLVHEQIQILDFAFNWECNNKFVIKNSLGQQVYYAFENTEVCMRIFCGPQRAFTIHVVDNMNVEVLRITRDLKPCAGCCWCAGSCNCCAHEVQIESPPGTVIGYVRQTGSYWKVAYDVLDENRKQLVRIRGPCCIFNGPCCPCETEFKVMSLDETSELGAVTRQYSNFLQEAFTTATNFSVRFPINMDTKTKAVLLVN